MTMTRKPPVKLIVDPECYVTPAMAVEMLKANVHNRRLSERLVGIYADSMKAGEWRLNGEPIIFDKNGVLQSGQHRLEACIAAQTGFWTVVIRGAEPESLYSLDSGRRRSFTDVLVLQGYKDAANVASAVVYVWRWQVGALDRPSESATHTHLLKVLEETPEILDSIPYGRAAAKVLGQGFTSGLMAALHWGFTQIDPEDAEAFFALIRSDGANLPADHPVFALLKWARRAAVDDKNPTTTHCAALVIKTWNAYRQHRTVRSLAFRGSEAFPEAE